MKKVSWILLGIFAWGIPTALMLSYLFAVVDFLPQINSHSFNKEKFMQSLIWSIPACMIGGFFMGMTMISKLGKFSQKK